MHSFNIFSSEFRISEVMEEKLKAANIQTSESETRLYENVKIWKL